ncbi:recombinase family protein [Rhizobium sp. RU36D]|uniref:recombinase family protein n=1 Tax=Rhizobium sp. RU36D TaxID=1907415 RepID=UPI0009D87B37|nr:recombinase family protein [Rhizobium sp. RU36D]SMD20275.1 Site-specific DNA recombinase [Rhizobium sp. RU36D]
MTSTLVGYARTSTLEQIAGLESQVRDLTAAGCTKIFQEQVSSVDTKRPELERVLDYVREGDTLVVTKLDRLARSMANLMEIMGKLRSKGVELKILALNLDTSTPTGKLMLNMLGSIAEFERELMLERQREGIAKAKADGKYRGRAPTAQRKADDVKRLKHEGKTVDEIAKALGISRSSIFRVLKEL